MRSCTRLLLASGATVLSVALTACGGSTTPDPSTTAMPAMGRSVASPAAAASAQAADPRHNAADVSFTQDMIVHHQGAIAMAKLAPSRSASTSVKTLAARIEAAQGPEIDQMTGWLQTWGQPVIADGSMGAMGMMSDSQMKALTAARGADFDRMFLRMMTVHHQGAIAMARTEQTTGSNRGAIVLARSIQTSQTAEITEMGKLLQAM